MILNKLAVRPYRAEHGVKAIHGSLTFIQFCIKGTLVSTNLTDFKVFIMHK